MIGTFLGGVGAQYHIVTLILALQECFLPHVTDISPFTKPWTAATGYCIPR